MLMILGMEATAQILGKRLDPTERMLGVPSAFINLKRLLDHASCSISLH